MKESQIAINSISTGGPKLEETVPAYREAGFRNVEFPLAQVRAYLDHGHRLRDLKDLLDEHDMRCIGGFETVVECFSDPSRRAENHARVIENAGLLAELGATNLVVGTDGPAQRDAVEDPVGEIARAYAEVAGQIGSTGVALCLEFNWSPIVKSVRTACEVARRSHAGNVGVLFDTAHYYCTPSKLDQLNTVNVPYIRHVHVNDMRDKPAELANCNTDRVLPGKGCLNLKEILGAIEEHGYEGYFSIEMFDEELKAMPVPAAAALMYESMNKLCDSMA